VAHADPRIGPRIAAAFWPLALFLAVEVLTRVQWSAGWSYALARYVGVSTVAAVAAVMSYRHMAALLARYGAHLGPLGVDGLMVVSGWALLSEAVRRSGSSAEPSGTARAVAYAGHRDTSASAEGDVSLEDPRDTSSAPTTRTATRTRKGARPAGSAADLLAQRVRAARELIAAGELDERPSAEAIRKKLGGSAAISRAVRDVLTTSAEPAVELSSVETNHNDSPLRLAR
jgi:hypothetical protein